jgi:transketolase
MATMGDRAPAPSGGAPGTVPATRSQREVFGEVLAAMALERDDILVLDGDLANSTRADIVAERAAGSFLEMGIAEQNLLGVAAGLATMGFIPYVSTFACFAVARALDQIRVTIAQPHLPVKIAAGYSGILTGSTGKTHQMVDDLAIMRAMPGMTVLAPADDIEAEALLRSAADLPGPVYIRLARDAVRRVIAPGVGAGSMSPAILRHGRDVALVSTGTQTTRTLSAAELLAADGIDAGVVHVPVLKPLDGEALLGAIGGHRLVVTVEEHTVIGGVGSAVAELIAEAGDVHPRLRRIGLQDVYGESGPNDALLERYGLSATRVAAQVQVFLTEIPR